LRKEINSKPKSVVWNNICGYYIHYLAIFILNLTDTMRLISGFFVLIVMTVLVGCGRDLEQAKRYTEMKSECDSSIAQASLIINRQKAMADSLRKKRDEGLKVKMADNKLAGIDREITNAVTIASNIESIRKHLEAIKTFAKVGETVNKRMIYYKRTYVNYSTTIQVHDEYIMIQEITEGLSAKQYIARYLPKGSK
jgi:hypothetical protein